MASYSATIAALQRNIHTRERALPLRSADSGSRFWLHPQPRQLVYLWFHGFTAAPWQWQPWAETFHAAGANVLAPLLPGHGRAGNWQSDQPPPLPTRRVSYERFAIAWLRQAQAIGRRVVVGGVGSGATLALWLAQQQPQSVDRAIALAPYLSPRRAVTSLYARRSPQHPGHPAILMPLSSTHPATAIAPETYWEWAVPASIHTAEATDEGYPGFTEAALQVFFEFGADILTQAATTAIAPVCLAGCASDQALLNPDLLSLFHDIRHQQPLSWFYAPTASLDLAHTPTLYRADHPDHRALAAIVSAYVSTDFTWAELQTLYQAHQSRQADRSLAQTLADLGWGDRAEVAQVETLLTLLGTALAEP